MVKEIVIFIILLLILLGMLFVFRRREARHLRKKTSEAFSPTLRAEIEEERRQNLEKREKFEQAMRKARE